MYYYSHIKTNHFSLIFLLKLILFKNKKEDSGQRKASDVFIMCQEKKEKENLEIKRKNKDFLDIQISKQHLGVMKDKIGFPCYLQRFFKVPENNS